MNDEDVDLSTEPSRVNWEKVRGWLIFLAVIAGVTWFAINYFLTQARENHAAQIRQRQTDTGIAALALKYNAITNWEASLPDRGDTQLFSIDVSRALNKPANPLDAFDGNSTQTQGFHAPVSELCPVLIKCTVHDIFEKDGEIIASLSSVDTTNSLSLELQCNSIQAKTFTSTNQPSGFAVVFKCKEAQRLTGDADGFSIKGKVLDVIELP